MIKMKGLPILIKVADLSYLIGYITKNFRFSFSSFVVVSVDVVRV